MFLNDEEYIVDFEILVSVPCRGAMFLNGTEDTIEVGKEFPSPVGELCFSIGYCKPFGEAKTVSVPCRGAMFLN